MPVSETKQGNRSAKQSTLERNSVTSLESGQFLILDHGIPFHADDRRQSDLQDPAVRRRGRGLGLDLIHRIARRVTYHPNSPSGNLTVLQFSFSVKEEKETLDV